MSSLEAAGQILEDIERPADAVPEPGAPPNPRRWLALALIAVAISVTTFRNYAKNV